MVQRLNSSGGSIACEDHCRELAKEKEKVKAFQAHCRLGDYAGKVFKILNTDWVDVNDKGTPQRADRLSEELREEEVFGGGSRTLSVNRSVETWTLAETSNDELVEMAMVAVHAYGARNLVCHSEASRLKTNGEWHDHRS